MVRGKALAVLTGACAALGATGFGLAVGQTKTASAMHHAAMKHSGAAMHHSGTAMAHTSGSAMHEAAMMHASTTG
jgi:hypothetical protein